MMAQSSLRFRSALNAICEARRRTYGTLWHPNHNISRSRIEFLIRFHRIKHFLFYVILALKNSIFRVLPVNWVRESGRVFFVCANTPTHVALLELVDEPFDAIVLPPGASNVRFGNTKAIFLQQLLRASDIPIAIKKTFRLLTSGRGELPIGFADTLWLFVSMIEAQALRKLKAKSIFLTHHLDGAAASAVVCGAEEYLAGMHGFPIGEYGWTPIWTDIFYVYGQSTQAYVVRLDPQAEEKIRYYKNPKQSISSSSKYVSQYLGLVVSGSHEDMDDLIHAAKICLSSKQFLKIIVFRHPSRELKARELRRLKSLLVPYEVTTLGSLTEGACFRCLIGNSTAVLSAILKGLIVFLAPSRLPRLDGFFSIDNLILLNFEQILSYEYPGEELQLESVRQQISCHFN